MTTHSSAESFTLVSFTLTSSELLFFDASVNFFSWINVLSVIMIFFYEFSYWVVSTNWNDFCKRLAISTTHTWEKDIKKKHWSSFPAVKLILYAKSKSNFDHFYASTWTETEPGLWVEQISWSMKLDKTPFSVYKCVFVKLKCWAPWAEAGGACVARMSIC